MNEPNKVDPTPPIEPTRSDPTPEGRVGDSRFLPVVIAAAVALIIILAAALVFIRSRNQNAVPHPDKEPHPTSQVLVEPAHWAA